MNLPEDHREDCKGMIINLIQNDLKIHVDVTNVRFHVVHRVESLQSEKHGQLLQDLCVVKTKTWYGQEKKKELKNSTTYQDAYIMQDYAKAIQQERRTLIKAMKARALGFDSKVIDRHLIVGGEKFTCGTIPEHLI